jgi:phage terminase small subunit
MPPNPLPQWARQRQRDPKRPLNHRQRLFCQEYVHKPVGSQAAIRAGYAPKSARVEASRLLGQSRVRDYIKQLMQDHGERPTADKKRIAQELEDIAFARLTDVLRWDANGIHIFPSSELQPETLAAIRRVRHRVRERVLKGGVIERAIDLDVQFHDKLSALWQLARLLNYVSAPNEWPADNVGADQSQMLRLPRYGQSDLRERRSPPTNA